MSIRWILLVLLVAYGVNTFASIPEFNLVIEQTAIDQKFMAKEIQNQLGMHKQKTLESLTESDSVSLEGSKLKIFR